MNLTEHFTYEELTFSEKALRLGIDNKPPTEVNKNILRLANFLEEVRKVIAKPIIIQSGYRSRLVNEAVGSKESSQHRVGCAADFRVPGMKPDEVCRAIIASEIQYDQLIREYDSWVHISIPNNPAWNPRNQTLIIDINSPKGRQFI